MNEIIARLIAQCPTLSQVVRARASGSTPPASSQSALSSLLKGLVGNRMYPLIAPERVTHPSMVYQLVSSFPQSIDGHDAMHSDQYVIMLRGHDYDELLSIQAQLIALMADVSMEVTDLLHDHDPQENLYRINFELTYSYLAAESQAMPAAFVYPIADSAGENLFSNRVKQRVTGQYGVLLVTEDDNIDELRNEVLAALLGWQESEHHDSTEYSSGTSIEGVGGMAAWREIYRDAIHIAQL